MGIASLGDCIDGLPSPTSFFDDSCTSPSPRPRPRPQERGRGEEKAEWVNLFWGREDRGKPGEGEMLILSTDVDWRRNLSDISGVGQVGGKWKRNWLIVLSTSRSLILLLFFLWEWKAIQQKVYDARWFLKRYSEGQVPLVIYLITW